MPAPSLPRLPPPVLTDLQSGPLHDLAPRLAFWKGMEIGSQGTPGDRLYIVARGQVLLSRRGESGEDFPLYLLGPGDLFGEGSLTPARRWLVTARAITDGSAHVLPSAHLPRLAQYYPQLTAHIVGLLSARLERAHRRVDLIRTHGARDRLLGLLCAMAEYHGEPRGDLVWVPLRLTQLELAQMVGLARETVARFLGELESEGLIQRGRRRGLWLQRSLLLDPALAEEPDPAPPQRPAR